MAFVVEENKSLDPVDISLFGSFAVMPRQDRLPDWSSNLGFGAVGGVGVPFLILSPPSITANGWLMALLALTVSIMTALLAGPTCRSGCFREIPSAVVPVFPRRDG